MDAQSRRMRTSHRIPILLMDHPSFPMMGWKPVHLVLPHHRTGNIPVGEHILVNSDSGCCRRIAVADTRWVGCTPVCIVAAAGSPDVVAPDAIAGSFAVAAVGSSD